MSCKNFFCLLTALVTCCVFHPAAYGRESFQLQVNDVSGLDEPWPLVGGLPFPEGEIDDDARIRVVDRDGKEVPAQIDVVAEWRDGSIQWAHVGIHASPQGDYRVEYGAGVSRSEYDMSLNVQRNGDRMVVDTGPAVYEFAADRLLPERAEMEGTVLMEGSGDGAYMIDNHGRPARVAGEAAEVKSAVLKEGPGRVVIRREGWYVAEDGKRFARARMWFYFTAGSPFVRMTHSLVLTEDTNELWVRDYGLELSAPNSPIEAGFPVINRDPNGMHVLEPIIADQVITESVHSDEVYMIQDIYPHYREKDARAVVARAEYRGPVADRGTENLWVHRWLATSEVVGDWAEGRWSDHRLTVVTPWLAQRFPKEVAFNPDGVRIAFWSGRSARELDFRAVTLVNEYWQMWALRSSIGGRELDRTPAAATLLAEQHSNAQGAARTHEVWLLPCKSELPEDTLSARRVAASQPPLLQADPVWQTATEAIGSPLHPRDVERFPREEEVMDELWDDYIMVHYDNLNLTGFIAWGKNPFIRGIGSYHFRVSNCHR